VGGVGWIMERLIVRPLFNAPKVTLLVATAGVALLAIALELKIGGTVQRPIASALSGKAVSILGAPVTPQQLLSVLFLIGLAIGLAYFFNKTDLGLAVLALSQEPVATELTGIGTKRMSSFVWVFASILGGIAGVLQAGILGVIYPGYMTLNFLLFGFTAAVVGGVTSLAGAFVGGLLIGVVYNLGAYLDTNYIHHALPGIPTLAVFVTLLSILLARPKGLLGREA
ncbi:MAG: branched-chain amino acid ABC transporter permease, partial [Actinomycetota bacterium]